MSEKPKITYAYYKDLRATMTPLQIRQAFDRIVAEPTKAFQMVIGGIIAYLVVNTLVDSLINMADEFYIWISSPSGRTLVYTDSVTARRIIRKHGWKMDNIWIHRTLRRITGAKCRRLDWDRERPDTTTTESSTVYGRR